MLVERGADKVVSFDVLPRPDDAWNHPTIEYVHGDIRDKQAVLEACAGADCVWHLAAAVGPYHPNQLYEQVNYEGTLHVLEACKAGKVPKLVYSSSPSTRFDAKASDVDGQSEAELPELPLPAYVVEYARTKAMGEMAVREACAPGLLTVAVAPHQVYGPRDTIFWPNVLEAAGTGKLRIFGDGQARICFTHVDNYCHGLCLAADRLRPGAPILGKFYVVTDGATHPHKAGYGIFWEEMNRAVEGLGFPSLKSRWPLPYGFIMPIAQVVEVVGWLIGRKLKLNPFTVRMLTMHRWFKIEAAERDLGYAPIVPFEAGWADTVDWFRDHWLPNYDKARGGLASRIAKHTEDRIDTQARGGKGASTESGTLLAKAREPVGVQGRNDAV